MRVLVVRVMMVIVMVCEMSWLLVVQLRDLD